MTNFVTDMDPKTNIKTDELKKFEREIAELQRQKSKLTFENSNKSHANIILQMMLAESKDEFKLYDKNLDGEIANAIDDGNPFFIELSVFLLLGKKMKILVDDKNYEQGDFYLKLKENIPEDLMTNIQIKVLSDEGSIRLKRYFQINDVGAIRVSEKPNNTKALCSFNQPQVNKSYNKLFDSYFKA